MKFWKKAFVIAGSALTLGLLAACGGGGNDTVDTPPVDVVDTNNNQDGQTDAPPVAEGVVVYRRTGSSIPSLAPHNHTFDPVRVALTYSQGSFFYHLLDPETNSLRWFPGFAAELPEYNDEMTVWTIRLREDLAFTNGTPINAHTYDYSWMMLLDPVLASPGAQVFFNVFNVVGARAYFLGLSMEDYMAIQAQDSPNWVDNLPATDNPATWADVGIDILDDYTIQFTLHTPTREIDVLQTFGAMAALAAVDPEMYEAAFNADRTVNTYGLELADLAQSGRFIIVDWARDQYRVFERNMNHPLAHMFTWDVIEEFVIPDPGTVMQMFLNGELDQMALNSTTFPQFREDPRTVRVEGPVVWGFHINSASETNPILRDADFRHALFHATDRVTIAFDIYQVFIPANYIVSSRAWVGDLVNNPVRFRDTPQGRANQGANYSFDPDRALELFNAAWERNGSVPVAMELQYFEGSLEQRLASEFMKEEFEALFGADRFELVLTSMPVTASYERMQAGLHDAGWGTEGQNSWNAWSSFDIWRYDRPLRLHQMNSPEFMELQTRSAQGDLVFDDAGRIDALGRMEAIVLEYMPWIPIYQNNTAIIYSDRVHLLLEEFLFPVGHAVHQSFIEPNVERSITVNP
ncbi:MAG: ABC transporter substrate-binding protein [Defluviitaleaceae bacterium]|nr:ABC transporter substrate-binding protein [Defluviitaleaceae bacterium]